MTGAIAKLMRSGPNAGSSSASLHGGAVNARAWTRDGGDAIGSIHDVFNHAEGEMVAGYVGEWMQLREQALRVLARLH